MTPKPPSFSEIIEVKCCHCGALQFVVKYKKGASFSVCQKCIECKKEFVVDFEEKENERVGFAFLSLIQLPPWEYPDYWTPAIMRDESKKDSKKSSQSKTSRTKTSSRSFSHRWLCKGSFHDRVFKPSVRKPFLGILNYVHPLKEDEKHSTKNPSLVIRIAKVCPSPKCRTINLLEVFDDGKVEKKKIEKGTENYKHFRHNLKALLA